jgi:enoyl-[acyl-carrier protein] reductase I
MLTGKKGLITGVVNNMSIAYAVARIAREHGARIALTYPNEVLAKRVLPISEELGCDFVAQCDVLSEDSMDGCFENVKNKWGDLDFLVHSIAFSDKNELKGRYIDTSLSNFLNAMHISCYSLTALAKRAEPILSREGSILTMSYYGSQKVIPNYNVMGLAKAALECSVRYLASDMGPNGIRVNAISAGPIKTLASGGITDFKSMLKSHSATAPLKRNVSLEDVAKSSIYLLSSYSSGVTGEVHYVDCGYNVMGTSIVSEQIQ